MVYLIFINCAIVLAANYVIYRIKGILRKNGFQVTFLYGLIFDIILLFRLSLRQRNYNYMGLLSILFVLVLSFIWVSSLILRASL